MTLQQAAKNSATAPFYARLKHLLATSPAGQPLSRLRALKHVPKRLMHPELAELLREDTYIDRLMPRYVTPGTACLDVGTHFGAFAYKLQGWSHNGWIGMIEASPWKAELLRQRFPNAALFETAVSDEAGTATFYENVEKPGFSSLSDRASRGQTKATRVAMARLDDLLPRDVKIGFLKIDVEGHEYAALRGGVEMLGRDRPVILFEAGAAEDEDLDTSTYDTLFSWLAGDLGYQIFAPCDLIAGRPPIDPEGFKTHRTYPYTAFNFFALPSDTGAAGDQKMGDQR